MALSRSGYVQPVFNLSVNIWRGDTVFPAAPSVMANATMSPGAFNWFPNIMGATTGLMILRLPNLTDIRDANSIGAVADFVECPAASGRWYVVTYVDDIAKGYPNCHRFAVLAKTTNQNTGDLWPVPIP